MAIANKITAKRRCSIGLAAALLIGSVLAPALWPARGSEPDTVPAMPQDGGLSVMTYNVEGLPWPVRSGREEALERIGQRLGELRRLGRQPHVVVLQEAFIDAAKRIGPAGGYRYMARGPSRDLKGSPAANPDDVAFAASAGLFTGERVGKLVDSGLLILSDYPIVAVRRAAFPAYACAGYDCLANKGMVMALIQPAGATGPIAVVDTHLNSRRASGADSARSYYAYRRQIDALDQFLKANRPAHAPLIVAGDFNVGKAPDRRGFFRPYAERWSGAAQGGAVDEALENCFAAARPCGNLPPDARLALKRGKDWQILAAGGGLAAHRLAVPFGREADGAMLSDHVGYVAYYGAKG